MSYLFDDASSHRLVRSPLATIARSIWFWPDDSGLDCTIWARYNGAGTHFEKLKIFGASSDILSFESSNGSSFGAAQSVGTVNYNAWNHAYWSRGVQSPTHAYISLNGETLVDAGANSFVSPTVAAEALGRVGTITPIEYFSGRIAEFVGWDNCLNDFSTVRYSSLALGLDPRLIAVDPGGSEGLGALNLISYSPLVGLPHDLMRGNSWTVTGPTVIAEHPAIQRGVMG